ncbi:hypothetical protein A2U01_0035288 [Trifolium medium]|uniref:Uncharacterized protein n=1 Tax=Trifolium medium TaxID=97028 RepID=A0A392PQ01_9FABA|nr:hypothetical protein [Trifolium medium]
MPWFFFGIAVDDRYEVSCCYDVFTGICWPVVVPLVLDLFLYFVSFINSLSGSVLVFGVPLSLLDQSLGCPRKLPGQGCPLYRLPRSSLGVGGIRGRLDHSALAVASWEWGMSLMACASTLFR